MKKTLTILGSKKDLLKQDKDILLWSDNYQKQNDKIYSILQILQTNVKKCKNNYISLISDLGNTIIKSDDEKRRVIDYLKIEKNFSFWWTTLIAEKSNMIKSPNINQSIKIIAFKIWFKKKNYKKITLHSQDPKLIKSIKLFSIEENIKFEIKGKNLVNKITDSVVEFYEYFPKIIPSLIWLMLELKYIWPLKAVGTKKWKHSRSRITFLSSLVNLEQGSMKKGEFKSNYWPILPKLLKNNNTGSNWIHMHDRAGGLLSASNAKQLIKKFNKSNNGVETHISIYSFINFFIVCKVIFNLIRLFYVKLKIHKAIRKKSGIIWPFIAQDFNESLTGITASRNLLFLYLFKNAFSNLLKQEKGFYLQENQGWECCFINAWKLCGHNDFLLATQHTPIQFWDLRRIIDKKIYLDPLKSYLPIPDYIGVISKFSKNFYIKSGIPKNKIIEIEALRYLHLNYSSKCTLRNLNKQKNKVLLLGDTIKTNTLEQIKFLNESLRYIKKPIQYLFKPHPATSITVRECPDIDLIITDKPINEIINCFQLAYATSTTSASFDAYYLGIKVVTLVNSQELNFSPLKDFKDAIFVTNPKELANVINNIDKIKKKPKSRENILYIDERIPRWKKIFEVN